jgi:hypothetical protein
MMPKQYQIKKYQPKHIAYEEKVISSVQKRQRISLIKSLQTENIIANRKKIFRLEVTKHMTGK